MYSVKSDYDGVVVLSLKGNLVNDEDINKLQQEIESALRTNPKGIVLNLKHLNWISSLGIGGIIRGLNKARKVKNDIYLAGLNDKVQNIVSVMKIDKIMKTFSSIQDAVNTFSGV